ncbi:MAG: TIGR03364 family FAD-dependent oxidoreductase [Burkholderiaceae bacterium]|nr:TIGR03364 family FAD-dependent oxidoreductase [Burkholderiaceae bacterium]
MSAEGPFDLLVVGAGIVGLAHALAGVRRGWRVAVVERDARCVGASVRNFGFVTVSGQGAQAWPRARRSREVWAELAPAAGIAVLQQGAWISARRPAAVAVLEQFAASAQGQGCTLLSGADARRQAPVLAADTQAVLCSPHELRVESRSALPRLAAWLQQAHGVAFFWGEEVLAVEPPAVRTARRWLQAERVVLCTGAALGGVAAPWLDAHGLGLTRLQMLRLRPPAGAVLPAPVLGDLSLVRYGGFAAQPAAAALRQALEREAGDCLAHGVHVIVVQSADGSWVVGDSHHADDAAAPFGAFEERGLFAADAAPASEAVDGLILRELRALLDLGEPAATTVVERWIGHYPVGHSEDALVLQPGDALRVVLVTSGTGASTGFALAEEVLAGW